MGGKIEEGRKNGTDGRFGRGGKAIATLYRWGVGGLIYAKNNTSAGMYLCVCVWDSGTRTLNVTACSKRRQAKLHSEAKRGDERRGEARPA